MRRRYCLAIAALACAGFVFANEYDSEASRLASLLHWSPGQTIAEIGAGEGQMSFDAAARVGESGHVFTTELDAGKLANLQREVQQRGLKNLEVVKADPVKTQLPDACCDSIFMRRVYHHFVDPAAIDRDLFRTLKPGGRLAVIDFAPRRFLPSVKNLPPGHHGHGIEKQILVRELTAAGFQIEQSIDSWDGDDYCVIARRSHA